MSNFGDFAEVLEDPNGNRVAVSECTCPGKVRQSGVVVVFKGQTV